MRRRHMERLEGLYQTKVEAVKQEAVVRLREAEERGRRQCEAVHAQAQVSLHAGLPVRPRLGLPGAAVEEHGPSKKGVNDFSAMVCVRCEDGRASYTT